jgi:hypothetical protein
MNYTLRRKPGPTLTSVTPAAPAWRPLQEKVAGQSLDYIILRNNGSPVGYTAN